MAITAKTQQKTAVKSSQPSKQNSGEAEQTILQKILGFSVEMGPNTKDILNFTNQLSVMVRAGMSLQESLESIASQIEKKKFRVIVEDLKQRDHRPRRRADA